MTQSPKGAVLAPTPSPALKALVPTGKLISLDCGNGSIKVVEGGGEHRILRSMYAPIPVGVEPVSGPIPGKYPKNSPVVELDGQRYHVGQMAAYYKTTQMVATSDKTELIRLLVAAGLTVPPGNSQVDLVLCHHSHGLVQSELKSALLGELSFCRNGKDYVVKIRSAQILDECFGSWYMCQNQGLLGRGLTLGLDFGCGTAVARLFDQSGTVLQSLTDNRSGVLHLAQMMAANSQLCVPLREHDITHPEAASILRGFEDGSYSYECTGVSWADWWKAVRGQWFKEFLGRVKSDFKRQMPMVDRFMVTGGGYYVLADLVKERPGFIAPTLPHLANAMGGWQWAAAQLMEEVN